MIKIGNAISLERTKSMSVFQNISSYLILPDRMENLSPFYRETYEAESALLYKKTKNYFINIACCSYFRNSLFTYLHKNVFLASVWESPNTYPEVF